MSAGDWLLVLGAYVALLFVLTAGGAGVPALALLTVTVVAASVYGFARLVGLVEPIRYRDL